MSINAYKNYFGATLTLSGGATNYLTQVTSGVKVAGSSLNDILKDNFGGNTLAGGKGDDTYHIVDSTSVVTELAGGGTDTAVTWTSYRLPTQVEVLNMKSANLTGWASSEGSLVIAEGARSTLVSGKGSDVLVDAGPGGNTFSFFKGSGADVIYGFKAGSGADHDAIRLNDFGFTSFDQVKGLLTQVGADTKLALPGGDVVLIKDVQVSSLTADDFRLQLDLSKLKLTFADEFNSISLHNDKTGTGTWETTYNWGPENGGGSIYARTALGNNEKQIYVDADATVLGTTPVGISPFSVKDGVLDITAAKTPDALKAQLYGYDYTSGLLTTEETFSQTYGYFEIRAEMPAESGMFPAFWLLREDKVWPPELDVFENIGTNEVFQGFGSQDATADNRSVVSTVETASTGFHTYGLLWTAKTITWYIDGVATGSVPTPPDMHSPMYMLVNLAVGGNWAGNPDKDFTSDSLRVDYIRAYSLDSLIPTSAAGSQDAAASAATYTAKSATDTAISGADAVKSAFAYTLPSTAYDLTLTGSNGISGTGNALDNRIYGNDGANKLSGLGGNDTLSGGAGNDTLSGGSGADLLKGEAGDDTYYVDDARAVIVENGGEGADTVFSSVTYTAGANIENVLLTGSSAIDARGGDTGVRIVGNTAVNRLWGGAGNDTLDGGKGIDILEGGSGDDIYYVDTATEVVTEGVNGGTDTVFSAANYKLAENVENLNLLYTGDISGTGNALNNTIIGNAGSNKLSGASGFDTLSGGGGNDALDGGYNNDVLVGGDGADTFVFGLRSGVDTISDFGAGGRDTLDLSGWKSAGYQASVYMSGGDTYVTDGHGDTVILTGVSSSHLAATSTGFVFI